MKKNRLIIIFLLISVLFNAYFISKSYINNSPNKQKVRKQNEVGYKFNAISTWFRTDASFSNSKGYFSKLNDTITIQPFLKVDVIYRKSISLYPLISLYELSETDSNFKLVDTIRYQGDNSFKFINKDTCTKIFIYRIDLPVGDSIQKFPGAFMLRTEMKDHRMSYPINEFVRDSTFDKFLKY